jgi:hypothetical protein
MQDKENVTIIIAAHNSSKTIVRAIESVTKGTRPANQVIIGDNDSSDGTYDILCNLLGAEHVTIDGKTGMPPHFDGKINDTAIKIFRNRSTATGDMLNISMQMKWQGVTIFGFMEPTSWYAPDKIAKAIRAFNAHASIACVVSDCDDHHEDGRVERIFRSSFDAQRLLSSFPYDRNFLVRTQVFPKLKCGFDNKMPIRDDYDFMLRTSEIGLIYHIPEPLHNNTVHEKDEQTKRSVEQCENAARQAAINRRRPNDG